MKKNQAKKEQDKELKKQKQELLHVQPEPEFDGFWKAELERVVGENPEEYSLEAGTKKRANAMIQVTKNFKKIRKGVKHHKEQIRIIKQEASAQGFETVQQEVEYIKQRVAELEEE